MADSRLTYRRDAKPEIYVDNVQKIFPIEPRAAFGFVGDLGLAKELVLGILQSAHKHPRRDEMTPYQLISWFRRFVKSAYYRLAPDPERKIHFMLAVSDSRFANAIERVRVFDILNHLRKKEQSFWLPGIFGKILMEPPEVTGVKLLDMPIGKLVVLKSPDFSPLYFHPLSVHAIGSG